MKSQGKFIGMMLLGCFGVARGVPAQQPIIPLAKMTEDRYGQLPVKGEAVVGVLADESSDSVGSRLPKVELPAGLSGKLCLRIASQDGTFSASAEYLLNNLVPNTYALAFRSVHPQFQEFSIASLAALAQINSDCSSAPSESNTILPVFWSSSKLSYPIRILLQTDQGDARVLTSKANGPSVICSQIRSGSQSVFDQECSITAAWKEYVNRQVIVDIRDPDGNHLDPISLLIASP
jgi:hypothetical protein